ncbi:MAG: hypothetical protein AAGK37_09685 [Pseudomonadota bacterium]
MIWFLRLARWARRPPSARYQRLVAIVLVLTVAVVAIEWIFGWPEALSPNRIPRSPVVN